MNFTIRLYFHVPLTCEDSTLTHAISTVYRASNIIISLFLHRIACISCPTLYMELLRRQSPEHHIVLLEYDTRFEIHGDKFIPYDYRDPLNLPPSLEKESFDLVVADPPFLSEECLSKVAQTVKFLARDKVILCTGMCVCMVLCSACL